MRVVKRIGALATFQNSKCKIFLLAHLATLLAAKFQPGGWRNTRKSLNGRLALRRFATIFGGLV